MTSGVKRRFNPSDEELIRINTMCMMGLPFPKLASHYGMTEEELMGCKKRNEKLRAAMEEGTRRGDEWLMGKLWKLADDQNTASIIFLAKVRLRMRERDRDENNTSLQTDKKTPKISFISMTPIEAARVYQQVMKD